MNWKSFKIKPFWRKEKNISEPVVTLGEEILVYNNWIYIRNTDRNFHATHTLTHKYKNIKLQFVCDIYGYWQCLEKYLTQDEVFYLGKKFKSWMMEHNFIEKQSEYRKQQKERQRIAKELGL